MTIVVTNRHLGSLPVTIVKIERPPVNVLDFDHARDLSHALGRVAAEDRSRLVLLSGSSGVFSAGVDIAQHSADWMPRLLPQFHEIFDRLWDLRALVVALVDGPCLGGGAELCLGCDLVVATQRSPMAFPEITVGCYPPVAVALLDQRVGHARACELILGGVHLEGEELRRSGLIDHWLASVSEPDYQELDPVLAPYQDKSPTVLGLTAHLLHEEKRHKVRTRIQRLESEYLTKLLLEPDAEEGIQAFLQKRPPRWTS